MNDDDTLTAVSLFAGIGGIDKALEDSGVRVTAAVEIDAPCRAQLAKHFPGTVLFEDVTKVTADDILATGFVPSRGILAGGWPCQGMSVAGRRLGLGDARSGLFWDVVRLADELRPQWLLLENVPGLLSAVCPCPGDGACTDNRRAVRCGQYQRTGDGTPGNPRRKVFIPFVPHAVPGGACPGGCMGLHGGAMGTVVGALEQRGYGLAWRVLDAQYFGVAQRRERVFFVGCLGDGAAPVQILLEPESSHRDPAAGGPAGADVAGTLGSRVGGARTTDLDGHGAYIAGTLAGTGPGGGWRVGADEAAAGQLVVPIQDGHFAARDQNGLGVGEPGAPAYTVDAQGYQAVATLQGGGRRGHRIDAEGAAGGHLIAFDGAQITHPENRANPQPGDPAPPLASTGQPMVAGFASALTGPLTESLNVGALPFALRGRAGGSDIEAGEQGDPAFALRTPGGGSSYPMVAATLTAGLSSEGVSAPGRRQEDDVNLIPVAGPATGGTAVAYALSTRSTRNDREQTWVTHALTSEGADASEDGSGHGTPLVSSLAFNWQAGGSKAMLGIGDKPTALTTNQTPAVTTAIAVRRLTPLECERLQGFPDNWTAGQSDSARYRQCGNAVAVPVVRWIAGRIVAADRALAQPGRAA